MCAWDGGMSTVSEIVLRITASKHRMAAGEES